MRNKEREKFLILLVGILFLIFLITESVNWKNSKEEPLKVSYLDVGQGDATLISYLGRYQILIDGGPSGSKLLTQLEKEMPILDKNIEIVILTHPDLDHLAGLIDVLRNYKVEIFLENGQVADTNIFRELESVLQQKQIKRKVALEGSEFSIGEELSFKVFNPDKVETRDVNRNENSIVLRMEFGENSFLFTGDATNKTEIDMIDDRENVDADWLKLGHHGSKHSSSLNFLKEVSPQVAIASAGKNNRYKHPNKEVVDALNELDIELLRTDLLGTINIVCVSPTEECLFRRE